MTKLFDYHVHTYLCGHAVGEAHEYVEAAIQLGLSEIGFSEHVPMYWLPAAQRDPTTAMSMESLESYVRTILDLRSRYPEIRVRLGLEADYAPGAESELERLLEPYPWDYVYGSIHYINGWGFDNPDHAHRYSEWDLDQLYSTYFDLVLQAADSGLFDILAHVDVIKKWGHRPATDPTVLYQRVAQAIARSGIAVEASTAGYRKPVAELYPAPSLLAELAARGVPFSLGSDAHAPGEAGYRIQDALNELRSAGVESVVRFDRRRVLRESIVPDRGDGSGAPGLGAG